MIGVTSPPTSDLDVPCPQCGYDLRGSPGAVCPECGLAVDSELMRTSGLAWAHRRQVGRWRAYFRTLWQVTRGGGSVRYEPARPQDERDARRFSWVTRVLLAVVLLAPFVAVAASDDGYASWAIQHTAPYFPSGDDVPQWAYDVAVPWSAGAVLPPVLPVCLIVLAFYVVRLPRAVFRVPSQPAAEGRARAVALYATGPLAFLLPALVCFAAAPWVEKWLADLFNDGGLGWRVAMALIICGFALLLLAVGATGFRIWQWFGQSRHCGPLRTLLALAELVFLWLLSAVVLLGLIPWCIGFVWIVVDSFRR